MTNYDDFWQTPEIKARYDMPPLHHNSTGSCPECIRLEALAMKEAQSNQGGYYNYMFNIISKVHYQAVSGEYRA